MADRSGSTVTQPVSHRESHSLHNAIIRNIIVGFADGLTVPFALTAGLSSLGSSRLVILGGLAELVAGAISMGLGAYLAASTERKQYLAEERREHQEVVDKPGAEQEEIYDILAEYGLERERVKPLVDGLMTNPDMWVKFMMDFELKLQKPDARGAWIEALVMGFSYLLGGIIPMTPYFALRNVDHALFTSIGITVAILVVFGYMKAAMTGNTKSDCVWSAIQTLLIGVAAAGASYGVIRGINSADPGAAVSSS
ncbi:hypothetical protein ANO11243_034760 [Dothideomycetidae sp. 11243]|nr:hypothetical protein ANO11243_034760 [fungal sp. No.11243]